MPYYGETEIEHLEREHVSDLGTQHGDSLIIRDSSGHRGKDIEIDMEFQRMLNKSHKAKKASRKVTSGMVEAETGGSSAVFCSTSEESPGSNKETTLKKEPLRPKV